MSRSPYAGTTERAARLPAPSRRFFWITVFPAISRREVILMNVQIFDKRFSENLWLQMATVAIVTLALIALGARYVW